MKKVLLILLSVFALTIFISCGSKPKTEETEVQAPDVEDVIEATEEIPETDLGQLAELIKKIEDARNEAIEAGADEKAPEQLKKIDDLYASIKDTVKSGDAETMILRYNLLTDYLKAKDAKEEIDQNDFASYAQSNYDKGVESLAKVDQAFDSDDDLNSEIFEAAKDAHTNFNTVLTVAYKRLAKDERTLAYEAKKKADSVKAGVAQKERYTFAADNFKSGDSLYSMQSPKKALEKYTSAKNDFNALYEEVYEKRSAAQAAIDEAKKRVEESAKYAEAADVKAPITEPVEGIEEEDAVLLEQDNYENPEEAEADIAETIDELESAETVEEE